ncbi:MAG: alpha/beta hydrolase family protein, partial [Sandaracinaceae bacterium]
MDGGADASVDVTIVSFRFDPDGEGFYRMPWPSDARLTADGTPDLSDFPRRGPPTESPLSLVESDVRGFSTMPVVYLPMGNGIAEGSIPSGTDAMRDDSPIQLVDLSEDACGTRLPIEARFDAGGTPLRDDNVLRVANAIGTVLTPGHPYGLLVLDTLGEAEGRSTPRPDAFDAALRDEAETDAISRSLAPLRRCAPDAGVPLERIAVATVFTPHDPAEDMQRLRDFVMDPSLETRPLRDWDRSDALSRRRLDLETHTAIVEMPVFQEGETPYTTSGGNIVFEDGDPVLQRWEDVAMVVAYGRLADPPSGPRPVLVFQDGTGWSPWTHLNRGWINEAIDAGYVVVSFMPQFHGGRAGFEGNTELTTFNLPNPPAGRSNFRQQAAETSFMVRVIREQLDGLDGLPELDLSHLVYGGHSQGALVGAIVAGVETEYDAYALNGLSSFLTLTILHRKDIIDFAVVVSTSYGFLGELDRFSLLLQMIQMGGDAVDPHNYATRWRGWTENPSGNHVFVINGREDTTTTPRGIEHLTMVADMPPTAPAGWDVDPAGVWDGEAVALPA